MRVLKMGNPPETEVYKGTCLHCSTILEALASELKLKTLSGYSRPGEATKFGEGSCLVCNKNVAFYPTGRYEETTKTRSMTRAGVPE